MKKNYLLFIFCFITYFANAQEPFITTWKVGGNLVIHFPIVGDDYTIDFGDGEISTNQSGLTTHYYENTGIYTVTVSGNFEGMNVGANSNSSHRLLTVEQWGDVQWTTMHKAFEDCTKLTITATDIPDLSQVTDMSYMFNGAELFNQPLDNWDVSNVTNMESMFRSATVFNQPLNDWDVSNVTNMEEVFRRAESFNQPLNDWDVSNVTNMTSMFSYAESFNQPLNDWNVSNVTKLGAVFENAISFNQPLNNWDISSVDLMTGMFSYAESFNQSLNDWDVSNVLRMNLMFRNAESFNQPLNNWDVSNVVTMSGMFNGSSSFNQDLTVWDYNTDISFGEGYFVRWSGLDTDNYDALLLRFAQLGLTNKTLDSRGVKYCNSVGLRSYLINELGWDISEDNLDESCQVSILSGIVLYDEDNDGCNADDLPLSFLVSTTNIENYNTSSMSNNEGVYSLHLFEGTYDVSVLGLPDYLDATPNTESITFEEGVNEQILNFCLTPNQTIEDLNITLLPVTEARPGFEANYKIIVENMGTQTVNNIVVTLTFDQTLQTFVTATPEAASITVNELTFEIENIQPFASSAINFTMQTFEPPIVNGDEIAEFTATVTPNGNDNTPEDNTYVLEQIIVNSYDPNDKRVLQGEEITIEQAGEYLNYIIRFQNTGTASAITVRVEDDLHENLDWTTFRPINASHDYRVEITGGSHLEFIFDDINLPHEDADAEGSNGYIAYKIKPVEDIAVGDIINGDAEIYFDYNLPIITNDAVTEVVIPLNVDQHTINNQLAIYPNPANDYVNIKSGNDIQLEEITVYNLQGRKLLSLNQNLEYINISSLSNGIYLLDIKTDKGSTQYKLIKN
ncbi:MAG: hypothetical protein BM557_11645 [Flavobacterium sp. MedPE-SWcel]|uniref:BspA family leucine-rich repeat surface protein n=1 Tax=uncultured Flavobacterium sp. TaxID=165435 RepID=UPI00090FDC39|nr:BspA family leucine-rich repeat surface protein [uncultured Flavobacterium sp.]OIQ15362.1 MAG: hypothetical protein BM557_11645 [Flavobacterium sp. MedPE-SWcel]